MIMHDLKSAEGVAAYLKGSRFTASDVTLLPNGRSAFTYRVVLEVPLDTGEKTIVLKHFEEFAARMNNMKLGVERADHEYKALSAIAASGLFSLDSAVQLPRPIQYDPETHTIFMYDLGSPIPLAQVLEKGFPDDKLYDPTVAFNSEEVYDLASEIGQALGDFLGRFHNWSTLPKQSALHAYFAQKPNLNQTGVAIRRSFLTLCADRFGVHEKWMDEQIAKEQRESGELMNRVVLVMGDCSLHNIIVSPPSEEQDMRIYLTDLEGARISYPEVDIGELTASATSFKLACYPNVNYPFLPALHQAYSRHRTLDPLRIGNMTGMDLLSFGPLFPWVKDQNEKKIREVALAGLELWKTSVGKDEHSIKANSILHHLFSPHSR